jgi:hypothetical protein
VSSFLDTTQLRIPKLGNLKTVESPVIENTLRNDIKM